ncbi:MAG: SemiSWEET transporter [Gammaproteobacteria bacterium]|nr:SemiSWEET transporter [Gammaproteobacteria bacterium]
MTSDWVGYAAAVFTTGAFVPQALHTVRTRDTRGLSLWMYLTFTIGVALWLMYGLELRAWPVVIANFITMLLALLILMLKVRHG